MNNLSRPTTIYEAIGGQDGVDRVVDALYKHIGANELLLQIFPEDLVESARKQRLFLTQFFGGPHLYLEQIGAPMLPYRHAPFEITPARRDAWLNCMDIALTEAEVDEQVHQIIMQRLTIPANRIVNTWE